MERKKTYQNIASKAVCLRFPRRRAQLHYRWTEIRKDKKL